MVFDSRRKSRGRRSSGQPEGEFGDIDPSLVAPGAKAHSSYIDDNGQRRIVLEPEDGEVFDPQAEIYEPKGETFNVNLAERKSVPMCAPDKHNLVPDPSETEFEAETCTRCPYGRLVRATRKPEGDL